MFAYVLLSETPTQNALLLYLKMLRAAGLEISEEDRQCRETLVESFGLSKNVSTVPLQPSFRGAFARKHRGDLSQSTLHDRRRVVAELRLCTDSLVEST